MRKLVIGLGIILVIAMAMPAMAGQSYSVTGDGWYYASGTNWQEFIGFTAQRNGKLTVSGDWGMLETRHGYGTLSGPVTGLTVTGNKAVIGGVIAHAIETPELEGKNICWVVVDNATGRGRIIRDQISDVFIEPISYCEKRPLTLNYLQYGNIVVNSFKTVTDL